LTTGPTGQEFEEFLKPMRAGDMVVLTDMDELNNGTGPTDSELNALIQPDNQAIEILENSRRRKRSHDMNPFGIADSASDGSKSPRIITMNASKPEKRAKD
jgi:hypothetical protein